MGERRRTTGTIAAQQTTGSDEVVDRLFVYATLRQGQTARALIANQIARCVRATTTGAIYVFPSGDAAFVEPSGPQPGTVVGEVVWLMDLPATFGLLDAYEGHEYARILRQVTLESGEPVWSWIYALADADAVKHGVRLEHGDWVRYRADSAG